MMILVSGGAASGKSEYAEELLLRLAGAERKTYLATMQRDGMEAEERIARHKRLRHGKGFQTIECPANIGRLAGHCGEAILLECLSNLTANELFGVIHSDGTEIPGTEDLFSSDVANRIVSDVVSLKKQARLLVVVTNEIFSDGLFYSPETVQYINELGRVNRMLAKYADAVVEVVYGIPVWRKGKEIMSSR